MCVNRDADEEDTPKGRVVAAVDDDYDLAVEKWVVLEQEIDKMGEKIAEKQKQQEALAKQMDELNRIRDEALKAPADKSYCKLM